MLHLKDRAVTVLLLLALIFIVASFFFISLVQRNWNELVFTIQHPALVRGLSQNYEKGSKELEAKLMKDEPTAEDKLIEAVADEVKLGK